MLVFTESHGNITSAVLGAKSTGNIVFNKGEMDSCSFSIAPCRKIPPNVLSADIDTLVLQSLQIQVLPCSFALEKLCKGP